MEGLIGGMVVVLIAAIVMGVIGQPAPLAGDTFDGSGLFDDCDRHRCGACRSDR